MGLFNLGKKKKEKEAEVTTSESKESKAEFKSTPFKGGQVIRSPRVTEKATILQNKGIFVFNVAKNANAAAVKKDIQDLYKVTPLKVNIINLPKKNVSFRGISGRHGGGKKAYVYVKESDRGKITI